MRRDLSLALSAVLIFLSVSSAHAVESSGDVTKMLEGMQRQMVQMQKTIDEQNLRIRQLEAGRVLEKPEPISWLKGAKYGGDLRLRGETFDFYDKNNDAGSTGTAADRSRNRFRFRLRWGFEKDYGDDWKVGFRLGTGTTTDQTSPMQTLGNSGYFTFKNILIDRAWASYSPSAFKEKGPLRDVKFAAGKFENPFLRYSTPIVWDPDVSPEGLYEQGRLQLISTDDTQLNLSGTAGQFIVNENTAVDTDAQLWGYQGAFSLSTKAFRTAEPVDLAFAFSYYDYTNWFQTVTSNTSGVSFLRTNSIVADDFRVVDLYPELTFSVNKLPLTLWVDYAINTANVGTEDGAQSSGNDIHDVDEAWGVGLKVGKAKKKNDWEFSYRYSVIGVNAVVAAYNDSDFGLGFTNRKGHQFGVAYQLTDNINANIQASFTEPLDPSAVVASSTNEKLFRARFDLDYKF